MENVNFDLSITISAIIAIAAIISPILTTLINNHHQKKLKEIEIKQEYNEKVISHQKQAFENYLYKAGKHIGAHCSNIEAEKEYYEAYFVACLYASNGLKSKMDEADDLIQERNASTAIFAIQNIIPDIQNHIEKL